MEARNTPPWRPTHASNTARPPSTTVPSKRSADTQEAAWVADEDRFVLQQAKKKAEIRVRNGRARPIDWLAVILRIIDPTRNPLDEEEDESELDVMDPEGVFEGLNDAQLAELEKDIDVYLALETHRNNRDFWDVWAIAYASSVVPANCLQTMKVICKDRRQRLKSSAPTARGVGSVSADVDRLLGPKSYEELEALERQIRSKLDSDEKIDVDYWEHLLRNLAVWKAKARLRRVSQAVISSRLQGLRKQQKEEALVIREKIQAITAGSGLVMGQADMVSQTNLAVGPGLDPEPFLKLRPEDKNLESLDEDKFLNKITEERRKVLKLGYVPMRQRSLEKPSASVGMRTSETDVSGASRFALTQNDDFSQATSALYEREVARGVNENEEIFAGEEDVVTASKPQWANKYRPRKPRYFNRVQMGYEWNKYNQTHYDHDNPPPKVVQGYKFNIFYPDLIDKTKAPTYRIERENGRKRGQSFAPAGEEDTCLIRFIAGPPYEDIAFRIVDKEWDYSAKRERGFRSSFDKVISMICMTFCGGASQHGRLSRLMGVCFAAAVNAISASAMADMSLLQGILQLHFNFKKVRIYTYMHYAPPACACSYAVTDILSEVKKIIAHTGASPLPMVPHT